MRAEMLLIPVVLFSMPVFAEEFSLSKGGIGPIKVHTSLKYEGTGERLIVTAENLSGQPIAHAMLCVKSEEEGCLFEISTKWLWLAGEQLDWNLTTKHHIPSLLHDVTIEGLTLKSASAPAPIPENPKPVAPSPVVQQPTVAPPPAQVAPTQARSSQKAGLTNESVVRLIKAGLGDDVIIGMVNGQPGEYSTDADGVIALKQVGASDKVIEAIVNHASSAVSLNEPREPHSQVPLMLHDSTPVRLRLTRNLSSADATTGDTIDFEVVEDLVSDGMVLVKRGDKAIGSVTDAEHKKRMARGGKLDVTIDYVRLATGEKVALRGVQEKKGSSHTGAMTGGIVATALIVWPAAPFFLFMHGKDVVIPKGTEVTAYTDGEIKLDRSKFSAN